MMPNKWNRRWLAPVVLAASGLTACLSVANLSAAPPVLAVFRRVEADPKQEYAITEENGPWTILAVTFIGEQAQAKAKALVIELRQRYKLPAYTHRVHYDYTGEVEGRGLDEFGGKRIMRYNRNTQVDEIAVLVGDYPTVDDVEAQRTLEKLRFAKPECLIGEGEASRPLAGLREMQRMVQARIGDEKKDRGPLRPFMTTNPLLPPEYFAPKGADNFVVQLNKDLEFSLLDCPGRYTIRVATFNGATTIDPQKIKKVESGGDMASRLIEAGEQAHKLTMALRAKGYEAYEYHDRQTSIVTVGSFEQLGAMQDGAVQVNPDVQKLLQVFTAPTNTTPGAPMTAKPRTVGGLALDLKPMAIEVPKRSIGHEYERSALGMR
ncbi:MAG: hypothetical protein KF708_24040 [Pirellulales bacterium]|nr:hypothetical protein [Pirellulales bacterium]